MNRLETFFGNTGVETEKDGSVVKGGNLSAFSSTYMFLGLKWSITVWAKNWKDAQDHCDEHGLTLEGKLDSLL